MNVLQRIPGVNWASHHPRLAAWIVLSVGMVAILIYEARDVGLALPQWAALIAAMVLVAGLCVYIVSWEDKPDEEHTLLETTVEATEAQKDA